MKKICISLSALLISATTLSAQVTQKQADSIVKEYLQNEMIEYDLLYINTAPPNEDGITVTTSHEEVFTAKYACWTYYIDESELSRRHYFFVKEDDGNLLEVIATNDDGSGDQNRWELVETTGLIDRKENTVQLLYPNPTTGQLNINNEQLIIANIEIVDIIGKSVYLSTSPFAHSSTVDISYLPAGIYWVKIRTQTGIVTQKISKY
jgi:hypothetical protein